MSDSDTVLRDEKQENPPNGHEYLNSSSCRMVGYENGDFYLRLKRDDAKQFRATLTPAQLHALSKQIDDMKAQSPVVFPDE